LIGRRIGRQGLGFAAAIEPNEGRDVGEVLSQCLPQDLIHYGLIPELVGRLPVVSAIHQLSRRELMRVLTEPRNALVRQFQRLFEFEGIELVFADDSLSAVADRALQRGTGARGLRSIVEDVLLELQFELPSRRDVSRCVVTKETIENGVPPSLVTARPDERAA
jgi:ATP-dependent Clp protease ATP-binding subunit ClpX